MRLDDGFIDDLPKRRDGDVNRRRSRSPFKKLGKARAIKVTKAEARALAERTEGAYSFDRYGSWQACAAMLLRMGFNEAEAEAILRSKITRWAADASASDRYGRATALDLQRYINAHSWKPGSPFIRELVQGTFGGEEAYRHGSARACADVVRQDGGAR